MGTFEENSPQIILINETLYNKGLLEWADLYLSYPQIINILLLRIKLPVLGILIL